MKKPRWPGSYLPRRGAPDCRTRSSVSGVVPPSRRVSVKGGRGRNLLEAAHRRAQNALRCAEGHRCQFQAYAERNALHGGCLACRALGSTATHRGCRRWSSSVHFCNATATPTVPVFSGRSDLLRVLLRLAAVPSLCRVGPRLGAGVCRYFGVTSVLVSVFPELTMSPISCGPIWMRDSIPGAS